MICEIYKNIEYQNEKMKGYRRKRLTLDTSKHKDFDFSIPCLVSCDGVWHFWSDGTDLLCVRSKSMCPQCSVSSKEGEENIVKEAEECNVKVLKLTKTARENGAEWITCDKKTHVKMRMVDGRACKVGMATCPDYKNKKG